MNFSSDDTGEIHALYQARLRAEEIDFLSREEHRQKLQKLIDQQNKKIADDFEFEKKKIERESKIEFSLTTNEQRIKLLEAEHEILDRALKTTQERLADFRKQPEYPDVFKKLLIQGVKTIEEKEIIIQVMKEDLSLSKDIINQALTEMGRQDLKIFVDEENFLPDSVIGGIFLKNKDETLRVDNTLNGRLGLALDGSLPQISHILHQK